jgi:hypothetical protein
LQYGNDEKIKQVSTENLFKPSMRKGMKERCTLAEMCLAIGIPILMHKDFSMGVCKPCGRKIRNANECYTFILFKNYILIARRKLLNLKLSLFHPTVM